MKNRGRDLFYRGVRGVDEGYASTLEQVLRLLHFVAHLVFRRIAAVRTALLADLLQALWRDGQAIELGLERQECFRHTAPVHVVLRERIVGRRDTVLQGEIQAGGR